VIDVLIMENPSVMADFFVCSGRCGSVFWSLSGAEVHQTKRNVMEPKRKGENECRISAIAQ